MTITLTITVVLLVVAVAFSGWLLASHRRLRRQYEAEHLQFAQADREQRDIIANLTAQITEADKARKQAEDTFKALAGDVLKQSNEQFLQLARKTFEGEQKEAAGQLEQRKQAVKALVEPIKERLEKYDRSMADVEKARRESYGALRQQVLGMANDQQRLRDETANLVRALRRPEVRGRWGEMQLRRVAEMAGMIANCDFVEQSSLTAETARLRPDMLVKLPGGRQIIVDAKTPLDAYITAYETDDEEERNRLLDQHARQVEEQVNRLAAKQYQDQFAQTPDFVVLFIPGESFLYAATQHRPQLLESAMSRSVVIATPTTLISLLKVVALGWREQQLADNAHKISELGKQLHERIATAADHVQKLGKSLEAATKAYNQFVGSFETRVMSSARRFKELSADSPKELPAELPQIEITARQIQVEDTG